MKFVLRDAKPMRWDIWRMYYRKVGKNSFKQTYDIKKAYVFKDFSEVPKKFLTQSKLRPKLRGCYRAVVVDDLPHLSL